MNALARTTVVVSVTVVGGDDRIACHPGDAAGLGEQVRSPEHHLGRDASPVRALTPDELSEELGIDRQDVIKLCLEEGVPIYQGKIDKTLFQAQLEAIGSVAKAS